MIRQENSGSLFLLCQKTACARIFNTLRNVGKRAGGIFFALV
ncbi:hypothetical protein BRPE64_DCDS03730 (plasmid) [Caballeronia insecticola]|uniref:Uncharacterized protein n=1 Tax=Caballeronia insecticola TaxID=758793 RepID=R4WRX3_9BURK|nr:hypothetical protein BRPE64_DCDS03730 [Caballeronia insecticola]